jgi:hypothetical protein
MQIEGFFLSGAIDTLINHFNPKDEDLVKHLLQSPLFDSEMEPALQVGFSAYLRKDHISSIYVLIPQIETAIRKLAKLVQAPIYRAGRYGDMLLRNLDDLLRDEIIKANLGSQIVFYLRILLTDQRGWNLRNIISHGLVPSTMLNRRQADRVVHVLLLISGIRKKEDKKGCLTFGK